MSNQYECKYWGVGGRYVVNESGQRVPVEEGETANEETTEAFPLQTEVVAEDNASNEIKTETETNKSAKEKRRGS